MGLLSVCKPPPQSPWGPLFNNQSCVSFPFAWHAWPGAGPLELLLNKLTKPPLVFPDGTSPSPPVVPGQLPLVPSCPCSSQSPRPAALTWEAEQEQSCGQPHGPAPRPLGTGEQRCRLDPELRLAPLAPSACPDCLCVSLMCPLPFVEHFLLFIIQQEECRFFVSLAQRTPESPLGGKRKPGAVQGEEGRGGLSAGGLRRGHLPWVPGCMPTPAAGLPTTTTTKSGVR